MKALNVLNREELYALVWSEAMATLGPKMGISDVGLKKRCRNLGVPTPPRGYWAKLEAGKKVKKEPLPDFYEIVRKKKKIAKSLSDLKFYKPPERDYAIEKPPAIVLATRKVLEESGLGYLYPLVHAGGGEGLTTKVGPETLPRAMWLWTELLAEAERAGLSRTSGSTFSDGTVSILLELKEKVSKYYPPPEPSRGQNKARDLLSVDGEEPTTSPKWVANGFLQFRADEVSGANCSHQWTDTALTPLEDRLQQVVDGLKQLLMRKAELAIERKQREAEWAQERKRQAAREEQERYEAGRYKRLMRHSKAMAKADSIRELAERVRVELGNNLTSHMTDWLDWAEHQAREVDPIPRIARDLANEKDPVEPTYDDKYGRTETYSAADEYLRTNYWQQRNRWGGR
ncbi:MAG: hypothetical protein JNM34_11680 [Chthonomonadaceae bacterium]|nr:hypothetical protein [Chthonomonadaceae bacterium]